MNKVNETLYMKIKKVIRDSDNYYSVDDKCIDIQNLIREEYDNKSQNGIYISNEEASELLEALEKYYEYQNAIGKQLYDLSKKVSSIKLQETLELLSQNVYDLENEICVIEKALGNK